jgi:hypothetical protein
VGLIFIGSLYPHLPDDAKIQNLKNVTLSIDVDGSIDKPAVDS